MDYKQENKDPHVIVPSSFPSSDAEHDRQEKKKVQEERHEEVKEKDVREKDFIAKRTDTNS